MKVKIFAAFLAVILVVAGSLVTNQVMANSDDDKAQLGVYLSSSDKEGALVSTVLPGTAADDAGLKPNDLILAVDGQTIADSDALVKIINAKKPGDQISILLLRKGKEQTLSVTLKEGNDSLSYFYSVGKGDKTGFARVPGKAFRTAYTMFGSSAYLGISHSNLTKGLAEYFGVSGDNGILVSEVVKDSPAKKAGVKAGDVIIAVNGKEVEDFGDLQKALHIKSDKDAEEDEEEAKTVPVKLTIIRDKSEKTISVDAKVKNSHNFFMKSYNKGYKTALEGYQLKSGVLQDIDINVLSPNHTELIIMGEALKHKPLMIAPRLKAHERALRITKGKLEGIEGLIHFDAPHSYIMSMEIDDDENVNINFNGNKFESIEEFKKYIESDEFKEKQKVKKEKFEKQIKKIKKIKTRKIEKI